jgi:hypothetical protein
MNNINNFFLDKNKKGHQNCIYLKDFIEKLTEKKEVTLILNDLSKIIDIPTNVLKDKSKQLILNKFNFKIGKFNLDYKLSKVFFDFFIFLFLIFSQIFNLRKIKSERKNIDIMLDNISHTDEIYRFKDIINSYSKNLVVLKKKISFDKKFFYKSKIINNNEFFYLSSLTKGKTKLFLNFSKKILKISLNKKFNYFKLINSILYAAIKYTHIFEKYNVKFLLHDRLFSTCPVRNFLLKKNCYGITGCVQVHLAESAISMFVFSDIIFTFGNEKNTKEKIESLGGKVLDSYGVGSLKAEHLLKNKFKNCVLKYYSDILIIGVNINDWYYTSNTTAKAYKNFLNYLKQLSIKFPDKKIIYKHHGNYKWVKYEENLFKNSNIKIVIDDFEIIDEGEYIRKIFLKRKFNFLFNRFLVDTKNIGLFVNSYNYLLNTKLAISFGSSMILEAEGLGKKSYFVNPLNNENPFFQKLPYLNSKIITNFEDLENKILKSQVINKNIKKNNQICVKGKTSHLIIKVINDNLNKKNNFIEFS